MRVYHERLRVPVSWWVLGMISVLMLGAGFLAGFDWEPALAIYGILTAGLAAILIGWGWLRTEVTALDEEQTRALRGPRADPAAYLMARPYLPRSVYIAVDDPAARGPYWLIGTRRPEELAAAIEAARPAARAGGTPVG